MAGLRKLYERLVGIEPGVSLGQWAYDRVTQNWGTITALFVSGGGMSYLAGITAWLQAWGPIVWGLGFFVGAAAFLICRYLYEVAATRSLRRSEISHAMSAHNVNVLERRFENQRLPVAAFFNHFHIPNFGQTFNTCELLGPGNLVFLGGRFLDVGFIDCQFVVLKPDASGGIRVKGVTVFQDATFMGGSKFIGCTIFVLPDQFRHFASQVSGTIDAVTYTPDDVRPAA